MSSSFADAALIARLENYTLKFPQEVLVVKVKIEGEEDTVVVFKGFSSSIVRPTAYDPEVPTIPADAKIECIDRVKGPYSPEAPDYIERDISLASFLQKFS